MEKTAEVRSLKSGEQILEKWRVVSVHSRGVKGLKKKSIECRHLEATGDLSWIVPGQA